MCKSFVVLPVVFVLAVVLMLGLSLCFSFVQEECAFADTNPPLTDTQYSLILSRPASLGVSANNDAIYSLYMVVHPYGGGATQSVGGTFIGLNFSANYGSYGGGPQILIGNTYTLSWPSWDSVWRTSINGSSYSIDSVSLTFTSVGNPSSAWNSLFFTVFGIPYDFNNHVTGWSSFEANADIDYPSSSASLPGGFFKYVALKGQYLSDYDFYRSYPVGYINGVYYNTGFSMVSDVNVFDPVTTTFSSYDGVVFFDFVLPYGEDPVIENGYVINYRTLFIFISEPFTVTVDDVSSLSCICAYAFGSTSDPLTPGGGSFRQEDIIVYEPDQSSFIGSYTDDQKKLWNYFWGQFDFYRTPMMVTPVTSSSASVVTYYGFDYPLYSTYFEVSSDFPYPNGNVFHIDMQMRDIAQNSGWIDVLDPTFDNPYYFIPTTGSGLDYHLPVTSDSVFEYRYMFSTLYTGDSVSVGSSWYTISSDVSSLNEGLSYEIFINGFNTGASAGYTDGYNTGFYDGTLHGIDVIGSLGTLFYRVVQTPFNIMFGVWQDDDPNTPVDETGYHGGLFNLNIFGVDLRDFALTLLSIAFIIRIVAFVLGNVGSGGGSDD